ncbi:hypothetical protein ASE99_10105 [Serratia sp. Leaf51]|nr:hypothetical protein ASE99_10105 [Serratia sp. Leaf51]
MYVYSAKTNMFYPVEMQDEYEQAKSWPADGKEVDEDVFNEYTSQPPSGKMRIADSDSLPTWGDVPEPTKTQLIQQAENQRDALLTEANNVTADWRTELALGIISDDDKAFLVLWMQYIKAVKAVDTSTAPAITWPKKPE